MTRGTHGLFVDQNRTCSKMETAPPKRKLQRIFWASASATTIVKQEPREGSYSSWPSMGRRYRGESKSPDEATPRKKGRRGPKARAPGTPTKINANQRTVMKTLTAMGTGTCREIAARIAGRSPQAVNYDLNNLKLAKKIRVKELRSDSSHGRMYTAIYEMVKENGFQAISTIKYPPTTVSFPLATENEEGKAPQPGPEIKAEKAWTNLQPTIQGKLALPPGNQESKLALPRGNQEIKPEEGTSHQARPAGVQQPPESKNES